ncbi:MAG: hypothetical protein K2O34_13765 [Acetatifactor sp.]|nr:hypothetical protein [Acetatifactor sp.]
MAELSATGESLLADSDKLLDEVEAGQCSISSLEDSSRRMEENIAEVEAVARRLLEKSEAMSDDLLECVGEITEAVQLENTQFVGIASMIEDNSRDIARMSQQTGELERMIEKLSCRKEILRQPCPDGHSAQAGLFCH